MCLHAKTVTILSIFSIFLLRSLSYSICEGCLFDLIMSAMIILAFCMRKFDVLSRLHAVEHRNRCKKRLVFLEFLISDTHSLFDTLITQKSRGIGVLGYSLIRSKVRTLLPTEGHFGLFRLYKLKILALKL